MLMGWVERCAGWATGLPRAAKVTVAVVADATAIPIMLVLAITLRRASLSEALAITPVAVLLRYGDLHWHVQRCSASTVPFSASSPRAR